MRTAIRKHLIDFLAVLGLVAISAVVAVEILSNQRLALPAWVPVVGQDFYEIEAEQSNKARMRKPVVEDWDNLS